jgi:hypothetical protein
MGDLELRNENQRDCQRRVHVQERALLMRFPISSCCSRSYFVRVFVLLSFILCILCMQPSLSFSHSIILSSFLFFSLLFFHEVSVYLISFVDLFFLLSGAWGFTVHSFAHSLTSLTQSFHFTHTASVLRSLRTLRSTGCWTARPSRTSRLLCATRS